MSSTQESEIARLQQLLRESEERNEELQAQLRPTTFEEYLGACHTFLSMPFRYQTDKKLSTKGTTTNIKKKICPTLLKPWTDFPTLQQQLFERVSECIPKDARHFDATSSIKTAGKNLCDRLFASEKDIETYLREAVDKPITHIITYLLQIEEARHEFNLGGGIIFENHVNTLSDSNSEVQEGLRNLHTSRKGQAPSSKPKSYTADQICVYKKADGTRSPCMVIEYKPPHKLSSINLRAGLLRAGNGAMNIPDIINRTTIPVDPREKFVYHSEWLLTAVITQTYGYMVESGLEYSKISTGEAEVFLQVKEHEPHTVYYHLAVPNLEAEVQGGVDILFSRTAVSQSLLFCLMAIESKPRSQVWRNCTLDAAPTAAIDHDAVLRQTPPPPSLEAVVQSPSSEFSARIHPYKRSPIKLGPRRPRKGRNTCGSAHTVVQEVQLSPSRSSDEGSVNQTPSKPSAYTKQPGKRSANAQASQTDRQSDVRHREYCTQACLLGLVRKTEIDQTCPNAAAHSTQGANRRHALDQKTLVRHIQQQLKEDPDMCEPLGLQGARGALFKLTLVLHGYTFVAKGTVEAFVPELRHEGHVYQHLLESQGKFVPVYLGNISLANTYFLDFGVRIVHMLLMSWAGELAQPDLVSHLGRDLVSEVTRAASELRSRGVEHCDVRWPNVLWNTENGGVMLIDFERSTILNHRPRAIA